MRTAPHIADLWQQGGPFIGTDGKPDMRVTVQDPWNRDNGEHVIFPERGDVGNWDRGLPLRWYQKQDNSQNETELPGVKEIEIDRSLDSDAATCRISIYNQRMKANDDPVRREHDLGDPGYLTFNHGKSKEARARWNHQVNEWSNILVPNAILRTYQGYGGETKSRANAIDDGNLILTGVWLIDEVVINARGMIEIQARDMAKLLIEQQLYLPLVPAKKYPLKYFRWRSVNRKVNAEARGGETRTTGHTIQVGDKRTAYYDSAVDRWYGENFLLHGHRGTDSIDGNPATFALSVGNSGPDRPFTTDWWEYEVGEDVNAVYLHTWGGNYTMYVSVLEGGKWQGENIIPYDYTPLIGNQPHVVDTGADIPYVAAFGTPWEEAKEYILPRAYAAQRVRISFRNHTLSQWGPWFYRCGIREVKMRASSAGTTTVNGVTSTTPVVEPIFFAGAAHPDSGYLTVSHFWQIDPFGAARNRPPAGRAATSDPAMDVAFTPNGRGHYILSNHGDVLAFGNADFRGSPRRTDDFVATDSHTTLALAVTHTGDGYWVVSTNGHVYAYGDAAEYANVTPTGDSIISAIAAHPDDMGLWVMDTNGKVTAYGAATHEGDWDKTVLNDLSSDTKPYMRAVDIQPTSNGNGYWISIGSGQIQAFGNADFHGEIDDPVGAGAGFYRSWGRILPDSQDRGYLLLRGNGEIAIFGIVDYYGSPIPGTTGQLRKDGNYLDYADIIKDLALWSGFLSYNDELADNRPPKVYGNIESTGSYSSEPLPDEMFDKRPVIDAINSIKEAVGYLVFIDDEGGFRFESPNFWSQGNFDEVGNRSRRLPEVDERVQLTDYSASFTDDNLRSVIIISSQDPDEKLKGTVTTRLVPQTAKGLRGLLKPAMWVNDFFQSRKEQRVMAELISLHIWFQQRIGQVQCVANPAVQINDQVRIYERHTAETYIHYVRGVSTRQNAEDGTYTMTLTTNWLGSGDSWAITTNGKYRNDPDRFVASKELIAHLKSSPSRKAADFGLEDNRNKPTWHATGTVPAGSGAAT